MFGDWIEAKELELIAKAKATGWLREVVDDARYFAAEGYAWDVALAMSCRYWLV